MWNLFSHMLIHKIEMLEKPLILIKNMLILYRITNMLTQKVYQIALASILKMSDPRHFLYWIFLWRFSFESDTVAVMEMKVMVNKHKLQNTLLVIIFCNERNTPEKL